MDCTSYGVNDNKDFKKLCSQKVLLCFLTGPVETTLPTKTFFAGLSSSLALERGRTREGKKRDPGNEAGLGEKLGLRGLNVFCQYFVRHSPTSSERNITNAKFQKIRH